MYIHIPRIVIVSGTFIIPCISRTLCICIIILDLASVDIYIVWPREQAGLTVDT